jgi:nucleoside-diphosphate-sugar epimerase
MKVLVTGPSSRTGPFVVRELAEHGHQLTLFSRRKPDPELGGWPWAEGDITDWEACRRALEGGFDAVQHVAAQSWPTDHPHERKLAEERNLPFDTTLRANILGSYNLLQAAVGAGVKVFVMTGSNCALGHGYRISDAPFPFQYLPADEAHPSFVEDTYSYSKLAGEELLASYTRAYGIRTYAIRAAGICNAERRRSIAANARPARGWNEWLWAWVGSEDVASAHRLLMEKSDQIEAHGAYFCNSDDTTALEPTLELVERYRPELLPDVRDLLGHASLLSNSKLKSTVGWRHSTSWR